MVAIGKGTQDPLPEAAASALETLVGWTTELTLAKSCRGFENEIQFRKVSETSTKGAEVKHDLEKKDRDERFSDSMAKSHLISGRLQRPGCGNR